MSNSAWRVATLAVAAFAFNPNYELTAWYRLETDGQVESFCVVPATGNEHSQIYAVIRRWRYFSPANPRRFYRVVEKLSEVWEDNVNQEDAYFVDSGKTVIAQETVASVGPGLPIEGELVVDFAGLIVINALPSWGFAEGESRTAYIDGIFGQAGKQLNRRKWVLYRPIGGPANLLNVQDEQGQDVAPEFEDCRRLASSKRVPLKRVQQAAMTAFRETKESS